MRNLSFVLFLVIFLSSFNARSQADDYGIIICEACMAKEDFIRLGLQTGQGRYVIVNTDIVRAEYIVVSEESGQLIAQVLPLPEGVAEDLEKFEALKQRFEESERARESFGNQT